MYDQLPEATTIELQLVIFGMLFDRSQSCSCSFLMISLLLLGVSIFRHREHFIFGIDEEEIE